jgi:catechol 2,3-dioxygenase-like lactoylglutathione lyase family enzyme
MSNLHFISPFFIVDNLKVSLAFYVDKLGFRIVYIGPDDDPFYAMVNRDQVSIMLKAITPDIKPVPNHTRHEWARWDAYISTEDPGALFEEYRKAGLTFHNPLRVDGDGLLGFEITDADGYVLFFGRPNT